jgi:2-dehydropantoate 2-reductase
MAGTDTTPTKTHWTILGAGAMGCLWAGYLDKAGLPVSLVCKSAEHRKSLLDRGPLTLRINSETTTHRLKTIIPEEIRKPLTHLLVCTKAQQAVAAVESLANTIDRSTRLLLMPNGMGFQEIIAKRFPNSPIYCASTTEGVYFESGNRLVHAGKGHTFIGQYPEGSNHTAIQELINTLPYKQLSLSGSDRIIEKLWHKLAINCAINGLTAIYQCRNGELLAQPHARSRIAALCEEIRQLMAAVGISGPKHGLEQTVENATKVTASNKSSMLQDTLNRRKTEIDYLNGYICEQAGKLGTPCEHNQQLVNQIKEIEAAFN